MNRDGHSFLIVLYRQKLSKSKTFQTLNSQLMENDHLIIYDNSPESMLDVKPANLTYFHDEGNTGLAAAYNFAVQQARKRGDQWLTIFDQDTTLPADFNQIVKTSMRQTASAVVLAPEVVLADGKQISPFWIEDALFFHFPAAVSKTRAAINSGMSLNLAAFEGTAPIFDRRYPLDFLDYVFFKQLQKAGKELKEIPVRLTQELSQNDFRTMSQVRFENFQRTEARFVAEFYPRFIPQYRRRLCFRLIKQLLKRAQWSKLKVIIQVIGGGIAPS